MTGIHDKATLLIVDDTPENIDVIVGLLENDFDLKVAVNGEKALEIIQSNSPPDLVLLDIMMPVMDGFQVLEIVKKDQRLYNTPVVMVTSLDESESLRRCLEMGADDYLLKPFDEVLLKARINGSLAKKKLHDRERAYEAKIKQYNEKLERKVEEKTAELKDAYTKLHTFDSAKKDFINLISHELRTPLNGLSNVGQMLASLPDYDERFREIKSFFKTGYERLTMIVEQAILLTKVDVSGAEEGLESCSFEFLLETALEATKSLADSKNVTFSKTRECAFECLCSIQLMYQGIVALIKTVISVAADGSNIIITHEKNNDSENVVELRVPGKAVPEHLLDSFFDLAAHLESGGSDTPIGLSNVTAYRIISLFAKSVGLSNYEDGVVFTIVFK